MGLETRSEISLPWNKTICVVGARNMGKTNLAQVLLLMKNGLAKSCDLILLFGNRGSSTQWSFLLGPKMPHKIYYEIKEEIIEELFSMNAERLKKNNTKCVTSQMDTIDK